MGPAEKVCPKPIPACRDTLTVVASHWGLRSGYSNRHTIEDEPGPDSAAA